LVGPKDFRKFCEKILWYGPIANRGKQAVLSSPLGHSPVHEIIDKELKIIAALLSVKSENGTAAIHPFVSPARTLDTKPVCLLDVAVYRYVVCSYYMAEWKHGSGSHPDGPLDPLGSQSSIFCQRGSAKRGSQGNSQDRSAMLNTNVVMPARARYYSPADEPRRATMSLYWLVYRYNNQISVVIEPGASHLSK
jgi:hypothetical protein